LVEFKRPKLFSNQILIKTNTDNAYSAFFGTLVNQ